MERPPPPPEAVLFDVGGTLLVEEGEDLHAGAAALLAELGEDALAPERWPVELERWIDSVRSGGHGDESLARWIRARLRPGARVDLGGLERRLWSTGVRMPAAPGARELLPGLRARGLRLAALSNTVFAAGTIRAALAEAGLAGPLEHVLASADLGVAKPDPRSFRAALDALELAAGSCWFVGDSWQNDVAGAAASGLFPVWIAPGGAAPPSGPPAPAHARIRSLDELPALLEASAGASR